MEGPSRTATATNNDNTGNDNDTAKPDAVSTEVADPSTMIPDDVPARLKSYTKFPPGRQLSKLQEVLQLEHIARCDIFSGMGYSTPWGRLFGGEILAQSISAAAATVPDTHHVHSCHGYFILAGQNGIPVLFNVQRTRTGRSFMTRTVTAQQENKTIFSLMISFHKREPGLTYEVRQELMKHHNCDLYGRRTCNQA